MLCFFKHLPFHRTLSFPGSFISRELLPLLVHTSELMPLFLKPHGFLLYKNRFHESCVLCFSFPSVLTFFIQHNVYCLWLYLFTLFSHFFFWYGLSRLFHDWLRYHLPLMYFTDISLSPITRNSAVMFMLACGNSFFCHINQITRFQSLSSVFLFFTTGRDCLF